MPIVPDTTELLSEGQIGGDSASTGGDDSRSYVQKWQTQTDDLADDQKTILDDPAMPQYGDVLHAIGLKSRRVTRAGVKGVRTLWFLFATYTNERSASEPVDSDGNPTTDPTEDRGSVTSRIITKRQPIIRAQYIGLVDADGAPIVGNPPDFVPGNIQPITNSALVPTLPFPEEDKPIKALTTVGTWFTNADPFDEFYNTVNDAPAQIDWAINSGTTTFGPYPARTMLCYGIAFEDFEYGQTIYYRRSVEFHIDLDGWYTDIANRGRDAAIRAGDAKVGGGTWSSVELSGEYIALAPKVSGKDLDGDKIFEDAWLDIAGHFVKEPTPANAIYIRWLTKEEKDFTPIVTIVQP